MEHIIFDGDNFKEVSDWLNDSKFIFEDLCYLSQEEGEVFYEGKYIKAPCLLLKDELCEELYVLPTKVVKEILDTVTLPEEVPDFSSIFQKALNQAASDLYVLDHDCVHKDYEKPSEWETFKFKEE